MTPKKFFLISPFQYFKIKDKKNDGWLERVSLAIMVILVEFIWMLVWMCLDLHQGSSKFHGNIINQMTPKMPPAFQIWLSSWLRANGRIYAYIVIMARETTENNDKYPVVRRRGIKDHTTTMNATQLSMEKLQQLMVPGIDGTWPTWIRGQKRHLWQGTSIQTMHDVSNYSDLSCCMTLPGIIGWH